MYRAPRVRIVTPCCLLLATVGLASPPLAGATAPELPPVRVDLASYGRPRDMVLRTEGPLTVTQPGKEAVVFSEPGPVTLRARGDRVDFQGDLAPELRLDADRIYVRAGKTARSYSGALRVTADGKGLRIENECSLEDYTTGVLSGECPASFAPAAARALAVAIRSYSYRKAYHRPPAGTAPPVLCDTTHCQVYPGLGSAAPAHRDAVTATEGQVLLWEGAVIEAVYSADCGGETEANEGVWRKSRPLPYLRPVSDRDPETGEPYCAGNRVHRWTLKLPQDRLSALFGRQSGRVAAVERGPTGRVDNVVVGAPGLIERLAMVLSPIPLLSAAVRSFLPAGMEARRLPAAELRNVLGPTVLRSLRFQVRGTPDGVEFQGVGYGHGVGLCQHGANGRARQGADYQAILQHYYSGASLGRAPVPPAAGMPEPMMTEMPAAPGDPETP